MGVRLKKADAERIAQLVMGEHLIEEWCEDEGCVYCEAYEMLTGRKVSDDLAVQELIEELGRHDAQVMPSDGETSAKAHR